MKFEDKVKILREKKHKGRETQEFLNDVVTMAQGEALEYLLGQVSFCNTLIDLTYRPMIPRPETEFWVTASLKDIQERKDLKVLDLFCGSGCIGLSVLRALPDSRVTFCDIVATTKEQIDLSCSKNKITQSRYDVAAEDCEYFLDKLSSKLYDVIFAVPPYVPTSMYDEVMKELHRESPIFFFDKEEGMYYLAMLLRKAKKILSPDGVLYMEFDVTQRNSIEELIRKELWETYQFLKDPYGHECAVTLYKEQ